MSTGFGERRLRAFFDAERPRVTADPSEIAELLSSSFAEDQARLARLSINDERRRQWYASPTVQSGVPLARLRPEQQRLVHRLLRSCLSEVGYCQVALVMGNENILDQTENWNVGTMFEDYPGDFEHRRGRDPGMYYVTIFGQPGAEVWGWRVGGHHLSLNYTLSGDEIVSATPAFIGANPARVRLPGGQTLRLQGAEHDLALGLLGSLAEAQQRQATLAPVAPWDVTQQGLAEVTDGATMNPRNFWGFEIPENEHVTLERAIAQAMSSMGWTPEAEEAIRYSIEPKGLAYADMAPAARQYVMALLAQYLERLPLGRAQREWRALQGSMDQMHFAWAGSPTGQGPIYFRLQAESLLVEYNCTQNGGNHGHSLWRHPHNDFGRHNPCAPLAAHMST